MSYEYLDYVALGGMSRTSGADAGYYNGTAAYNAAVTAGSLHAEPLGGLHWFGLQ